MSTAIITPTGAVDGVVDVCLPLPRERDALTGPPPRRTDVLIAHRPDEFRSGLRQILSDAGYDVFVADDAKQTLGLLADEKRKKPDFLVIEEELIGMPATEALRQAHKFTDMGGVRVIMLSDSDLDESLLRGLGVGDILKKPVAPADVLRAIQRLERNVN